MVEGVPVAHVLTHHAIHWHQAVVCLQTVCPRRKTWSVQVKGKLSPSATSVFRSEGSVTSALGIFGLETFVLSTDEG